MYLCLVAEVLSVSSCQMLEKNGFDLIPTVQPVMLSNAHRFFAIRQKTRLLLLFHKYYTIAKALMLIRSFDGHNLKANEAKKTTTTILLEQMKKKTRWKSVEIINFNM